MFLLGGEGDKMVVEGWLSGRKRTTRNRVGPLGLGGSNPPPSAMICTPAGRLFNSW